MPQDALNKAWAGNKLRPQSWLGKAGADLPVFSISIVSGSWESIKCCSVILPCSSQILIRSFAPLSIGDNSKFLARTHVLQQRNRWHLSVTLALGDSLCFVKPSSAKNILQTSAAQSLPAPPKTRIISPFLPQRIHAPSGGHSGVHSGHEL
jgi:hypothetical protein